MSCPAVAGKFGWSSRRRPNCGSLTINKTAVNRKAASLSWRLNAEAEGGLESGRRAGVTTAQRHAHAALRVYLRGCVPVDFVGADHAAAATGQFVADAIVLIGVIAYLEHHA